MKEVRKMLFAFKMAICQTIILLIESPDSVYYGCAPSELKHELSERLEDVFNATVKFFVIPWYCSDNYISVSPIRRIWIVLTHIFKCNLGEITIPDSLVREIAACLLPDILAFLETEEAQREFEEWKAKKTAKDSDSKTA